MKHPVPMAWLSLVVCGWFGPLSAGEAERQPAVAAVFVIENRGSPLKPQELEALTDYLGSRLGESGLYRIIPRSEIRSRLRQQQTESYKSCYDQNCQIEIGRELAANLAISSSISRVGSQCLLVANLFDLRKAASLHTATAKASCQVDDLITAIETVAGRLTSQAGGGPRARPDSATPEPEKVRIVRVPVERKSVFAAVFLSGIPGGGMYYLNKWGWGVFYSVTIVGSMVSTLVFFMDDSLRSYTMIPGITFVSTAAASMVHSGVAAYNWRPPESEEGAGQGFTPLEGGRSVRMLGQGLFVPLWSGRF